jgi:glycosyltransferase involved in cell wall biosynthesis
VVHLNPSLNGRAVLRDGLAHRAAKRAGARTVVFFHGWSEKFARRIDRGGVPLFRRLFRDADALVVLARGFAERLRDWGFRQPIHVEVTVTDPSLLGGLDVAAAAERRVASRPYRLLTLSRIVRGKGHMETIRALAELRRHRSDVELVVAGDGEEREAAVELAERLAPGAVRFPGFVSGEAKRELFEGGALLSFPTSHGEGLPLTLVEAMLFGLPVVTRPVGGIGDFFVDGEHGFALDDVGPRPLAAAIARLLDDPGLYRRVALGNHRYARERFLAADAARRLAAIYAGLASERAGKNDRLPDDEAPERGAR